MFDTLWRILLSVRGEVGDTTEGEPSEEVVESTGQDDQSGTDAFEQAKASGQSQVQETEEQFIDPATLPDEIKPHWKRMHSEYNKRLKAIKDVKSKSETYDRFYNDPAYANQVLQGWAAQNGYTLTKAGEQAQATKQQQAKAPEALIEAFKQNLSPELQWMAESQANAYWSAQQMMMAPLAKRQQESELASRNAEYDTLAEELTETAPEWEDKETEMTELVDFLTGPNMRHKKFGNKLSLLYNIVNGNSAAVSEATKRMVAGVKNRNANGNRTVTRSAPNLAERIKKASTNDAWELAKNAALGEG